MMFQKKWMIDVICKQYKTRQAISGLIVSAVWQYCNTRGDTLHVYGHTYNFGLFINTINADCEEACDNVRIH